MICIYTYKEINNNQELKDIIICITKKILSAKGYATHISCPSKLLRFLLLKDCVVENERMPGTYFLKEKFYKKFKGIINNTNFSWVEIELMKNYSPFHILFFDCELMHLFLNNPNYHFRWNGYRGYVYSNEDAKMSVNLRDLCLCYDLEKNIPVIGIFITDLMKNSALEQTILRPYVFENELNKYEFHPNNFKNLFEGNWLETCETDIYSVILVGIKIINFIFNKKYGVKIFKNEYSNENLQFFMPIFYPTKINYFNFLMETSKILIENINSRALKILIRNRYNSMRNNSSFSLEELVNFKELKTFKTYFSQYEKMNEQTFIELEKIWEIRTEPAHKIFNNDINIEYYNQQDKLLQNIYRIICDIIRSEDEDWGIVKEYNEGSYSCFFGPRGAISLSNGFNSCGYRFYNGYIRLINEKYNVRDAEILIAGNDIEKIKQKLVDHMSKNNKNYTNNIKELVDYLFNDDSLTASRKEIQSFFYGKAYIKRFYGECKDYKKTGKIINGKFCNKSYKYVIAISDSTDMYWDYDEIWNRFNDEKSSVFGSGLLVDFLTNNFASDETNILNINDDIFIEMNVWD